MRKGCAHNVAAMRSKDQPSKFMWNAGARGRQALAALVSLSEDWRFTRFVPLAIVLAYWLGPSSLLATVSLVLPSMLALKEVTRRRNNPRAPDVGERDFLTPFGNRAFALRRAGMAMSGRKRGHDGAILVLQLVDQQAWQNRRGSAFADRLGVELVKRAAQVLRSDDAIARTDAGCVVIVLDDLNGDAETRAIAIAQRLQDNMDDPLKVDGVSVTSALAVGICPIAKTPLPDGDSWLDAATLALGDAQMKGGGIRIFDRRMQSQARQKEALAADLEAALEGGELRAWYQPQISATDGRVTGLEALVRWHHPENGILPPGVFLDQIAALGLSERLSEVMIYQSLSRLRDLDRAGASGLNIGINLSTDELRNPRLVEKLKWEADRFDIAPDRICVEVLETVVCETDDDIIARNLRALASAGFTIDLDDFGTGHAAIANIRRFAVQRIKIDRGFVSNLSKDDGAPRLIASMVAMADSLGVETLAEGVEEPGDIAALAALGVQYLQGYGIARPMEGDSVFDWIKAYAPVHPPAKRRAAG